MFKRKENWNTALSLIPSPKLIPNLERAAKRICEFLSDPTCKMLIVGDYDCDGIMATTIFSDFMSKTIYSKQVSYIVPDRFVDGYGVSINMIDYALKIGATLIVTVDNGIGAKHATDYATEKGVEVIITDHHTPGDAVPEVDIIVDLKLEAGDFPLIEISGATVAWFLCCQLREELDAPIDMRQYLDLVAITVISDVMPLESFNLTFFDYGMKLIKAQDRRVFELIFNKYQNHTLNETDIGFKLVPMINASGRIDHAKHAVDLFLSTDMTFIKKKVTYLLEINNKRKTYTQELLTLVMPEAMKQMGDNAIIIRNKHLHEGIVGIIAGKLAEQFRRPAYVFGFNEKKDIWKGSGRTSGLAQLYDLSATAKEHVFGFGGHAGAVGVAIKEEGFLEWTKVIKENASLIEEDVFYALDYEPKELHINQIDSDLLNHIEEARPFGQGFKAPVFKTTAFVEVADSFKNGLHWKCIVHDNSGCSYTAWFFHDKTIGDYADKTLEFHYFPQKIMTADGEKIELHATIPFKH